MPDELPRFVVKENFQKGGSYRALLSSDVLTDIAWRLTGQARYTVEYETEGYNVGRLAMLYHRGKCFYVSISETEIRSRNSSFQSFPSALSRYVLDPARRKRICFYLHPQSDGNFATPYFIFMYRLMKTAGVDLINVEERIHAPIVAFAAPEDVIAAKDRLRARQTANASTYVTSGVHGEIEVYGKTYGANKYETTLLCLALAAISPTGLALYEVGEGGLSALPAMSRQALRASGRVSIETSTIEIERAEFVAGDSLRSIRFIYNLLEKFRHKSCAFCDCRIPQIVQGAHIWPVASIKQSGLALEDQLAHALDGHNGLWLCENHHKLLDSGTIFIAGSGHLKYKKSLTPPNVDFLRRATTIPRLAPDVLHPRFVDYLGRRNATSAEASYASF